MSGSAGGGTSLRDYSPRDREACLAVFDSNVPNFFVPRERAEFAAFLDDLPGPYFVFENEDGVVAAGGYAVNPASATADLCWDMVRGDLHGSGFGRRLVRARLERIRHEGSIRTVTLCTSQHTRGFYERLGFVTSKFEPDGFFPGLDRYDMSLDLETYV